MLRHDVSAPTLRAGDHLCWAFADNGAFTSVAFECVKEGIEAGERVVFSANGTVVRLVEAVT